MYFTQWNLQLAQALYSRPVAVADDDTGHLFGRQPVFGISYPPCRLGTLFYSISYHQIVISFIEMSFDQQCSLTLSKISLE